MIIVSTYSSNRLSDDAPDIDGIADGGGGPKP
jgi:hypothetical protein